MTFDSTGKRRIRGRTEEREGKEKKKGLTEASPSLKKKDSPLAGNGKRGKRILRDEGAGQRRKSEKGGGEVWKQNSEISATGGWGGKKQWGAQFQCEDGVVIWPKGVVMKGHHGETEGISEFLN